MSWSKWVRQFHRWVSVAFTLVVLVVTALVALGREEPAEWVYLMPLLPLALLAFSGLYLFVLPYTARWRGTRRGTE